MPHVGSAAAVLIQMSPTQRDELKRRAAAEGMTLRAYCLRTLGLGEPDLGKPGRAGRKKPDAGPDQLPLSEAS